MLAPCARWRLGNASLLNATIDDTDVKMSCTDSRCA
jgi:hypothetical protein